MSSPPRRSSSPRGIDALIDALHYPLRTPAWITGAIYVVGHIVAAVLPVIGFPLHALLMLGFYRYAFESLVASAEGRDEPPEVISSADESTHRRHLALQLVWLALLVAAPWWIGMRLGPWLLVGISLSLPGALIALVVAQNLVAALNPRSWWIVATRLELGYVLLAFATALALAFQAFASELIGAGAWRLVMVAIFHAFSQYLTLALFRSLGMALRSHAAALQFDADPDRPVVLQRDREQAALAQEREAALAQSDPAARADAIRRRLEHGGDSALHREYREILRQLGRNDELARHAAVRVCELVVLKQWRAALALASEALQDRPTFTLPDASALSALVDAGEGMGMLRQVAAMAANYGETWPKRHDGLPLMRRAALLYADRLQERDRAEALLERAAALAGDHPDALEFERLRQRLTSGLPLRETGVSR